MTKISEENRSLQRLGRITQDDVERATTAVAKRHGCDRAVFTVCWAEHEGTGECRCKADAIKELEQAATLMADKRG